ncbi:hypothetical protein DAI22_04g244501 [Oryza sativa Japonica Group]|nr:hypothetical protein DAI22_04g244501 [Oryza sativa Japonica Group]
MSSRALLTSDDHDVGARSWPSSCGSGITVVVGFFSGKGACRQRPCRLGIGHAETGGDGAGDATCANEH